MNAYSQEVFYASIILFIITVIYLREQTQVTIKIYKYIAYILLIAVGVVFFIFSLSRWLEQSEYIPDLFWFILIYIITCFATIIYILNKHFKCTAWFPRILFTLFTLSLYYIPTLFGMLITLLVYGPD